MAYDVFSKKRNPKNFALTSSMGDDPILWTSASAKAEFDRIRTVLDTVNLEISQGVKDNKISSDEWKQWFSLYKAGHKLTNQSTWLSVSKGDIIIARKIEQDAKQWHDLLLSRGGSSIGPKDPFRKPDDNSLGFNTTTALIAVGSVFAATMLINAIKK